MKQFVLSFNPPHSGKEEAEREERIRLSGKDFHYLCRVRRYGSGSRLPALSPDGRRFELEISAVSGRDCVGILRPLAPGSQASGTPAPGTLAPGTLASGTLASPGALAPEELEGPAVRIYLMAALTKGRKMDLTVRQAVEAGAAGVFPLETENSQVRLSGEGREEARMKRRERWEKIAVEALQQCGGDFPTSVEAPVSIEKALERWRDRGPVLFLHEKPLFGKQGSAAGFRGQFDKGADAAGDLHGGPERETAAAGPGRQFDKSAAAAGFHSLLAEQVRNLAIMIGPEGGFSPAEVDRLLRKGARPVYLGKRVLRAETAALYALAAAGTIIRERREWQLV